MPIGDKFKETLQSVTPSALKKGGKPTGTEEGVDPTLKDLKRDEMLEILVKVARENEELKEKLAESQKLVEEYKRLLDREDRLRVLEENQEEQLKLLRSLAEKEGKDQ